MASRQHHEHQSLLQFRAEDGFAINAFMLTEEGAPPNEIRETPILLQVHGLLGHFLARGTPRNLPHELLKRGFSSLSIDTRLAHAGQMTGCGIFDDALLDVDASLKLLVEEGFKNIFILGYSLGAAILVYWASQRRNTPVKGLILEGCPHSLPDSRKSRWEQFGSIPSHDEIHQRALEALGADPYNSPDDRTFVVSHSKGQTSEPLNGEIYTYKTWWFMLGPEAYSAMPHRHIANVDYPVLLMRGAEDYLLETWEAERLVGIAEEASRSIRLVTIPGARHDCLENPQAMLDELAAFIKNE